MRFLLHKNWQQAQVRPFAVMAAIAVLAVVIRAPFNTNVGVDEAYYLVIGRQWLHGLPPYVGSFDVKPPLLFLLMAMAEAIFGPTLFAAKALTTAAVAITSCGFYWFGRRFLGELAGAAAALLYIFSALNLGGTFSPAELIMAPFTTFGMLAGVAAFSGAARIRLFALLGAGFLFGAAACVKQTACFEAAAFALALLLGTGGRARWQAFGSFAAGFSIVPLGFALYFSALGHFTGFIGMAAVSAFQRSSASDVPAWSEAFLRMIIELVLIFPIVILAAALWASPRLPQIHATNRVFSFLAAWTMGALAGLIAARALIDFYALTLLQPLCLAAGISIEHVLGRFQNPVRRWAWRAAALGIPVYFFVWSAASLYFASGDTLKASEAAASLMREANLQPEDRILVADRDLIVYVAAGADPPAAIFHPLQLLCDFPLPGAGTAFADSLDRDPVFIAVADPAFRLSCERPERRARLEARLVRDYCRLGRFGNTAVRGRPGAFIVYGLKKRMDPTGGKTCPHLEART